MSFYFRGLTKSHIYHKCTKKFECGSGKWILQSLIDPKMRLEFVNGDFPIGSQEWIIMENHALCNKDKGHKKKLILTQCYPDKFTCGSGHCIPLENRCDINFQCKDLTDEHDCHLIQTGNHYAKNMLPVSYNFEPLIVYINISVFTFPLISTKYAKFTADFHLNLRWHDLRLDLWDLDHNFNLNRLSGGDEEDIWMPKLSFINALGSVVSVGSQTGIAIRENDPLKEDISQATEGN